MRYLDALPGWSPDLTLRAVQPGDRYLICSDGLSGFTLPGAIRDVLAGSAEAAQAADDLVALAYAAGAPDNVTVIVVERAGRGLGGARCCSDRGGGRGRAGGRS